MTAGAHDAGGGFGRSAGTNAARGIMVIIAAVAVGLLLMWRGIGNDDTVAADAVDDPTAVTTEGDVAPTDDSALTTVPQETVPETTTTVAVVARDPSEVRVLVINGTDEPKVKGLGGRGTDLLKPFNYITLDTKNADVNGPSTIFYVAGYEAEAAAVATVYGVDPAAVLQPIDPVNPPIADTQDANVIVRIGSDGVIQV